MQGSYLLYGYSKPLQQDTISMENKFIADFLKRISMNESSGGQNTDHKQIKHGIHKGDKASGQYGVMRNTADEMARRNELNYTPNPDETAVLLAEHLAKKTNADEEAMAAGWTYGHNSSLEKLDKLKKSDYVKNYLKHKMNEDNKSQSEYIDTILKNMYKK